jgi:hypothetical protein
MAAESLSESLAKLPWHQGGLAWIGPSGSGQLLVINQQAGKLLKFLAVLAHALASKATGEIRQNVLTDRRWASSSE